MTDHLFTDNNTNHPPTAAGSLPRRGNRVTRALTIAILALFGWRVTGSLPDVPKALLIGAPHTTNWDFLLTVAAIYALGIRLSWMGKHTFVNGFGKPLWHWLGGIPIDRRATHGMVGSMIEAFNHHDQLLVGITPEGTRSETHKWHSGFYHIAMGANVPILPVAFDYGRKEVHFYPIFRPTGDKETDITHLQTLYQDVKGKFPHSW
ncbi:MAG: lysophospholipid acyltransferase family protein [Chloroflexi bacterium]|nr:lysophospholipid acyltransferase family protein [Chloroflexota bacterium]MBK7177234.1 lysophospholipid acyltransferase family protein [Chloroflexota bacterium]